MLISRRADLLLASALACVLEPRAGVASPSDSDGDEDVAIVSAKTHRPERRLERSSKPVAFDPNWLQPFFKAPGPHKAVIDFQQEQWAAAEAGFMKAATRMPAGSDERQAARFLAALAKANQAKWGDAATLFEALFRDYPRLAPYHAYNAARCRLREGKPQSALEWTGKVASGSVPEAEADLVHLDALRALGRWPDAAKGAAAYLVHFPAGPRRPEALFKQAEALERAAAETHALEIDADLADITALYRRVWSEAPLDDWGTRSAERLEAIAAALPPDEAALVRRHLAREWFSRGMVYFDRNRNVESEIAFTNALGATGLDVDLECRVRYHRAQSVWKQRQRPRAAPLFDEADVACARASNDDLHAKALYNGARSWATAGDRSAAQHRYERVESEHADHTYADDARLREAELATDGGDEDAANKILAELSERYPKGDQLGEALWRLAFSAWRRENYAEVARWLDENLRRIPREEIWYAEGRALYWKGRVLEKQREPEAARASYARAVREYPLSVYALFSFARLSEIAPRAQQALLRELRDSGAPASFRFAPRPMFGDLGFRRAVDLARMGQGGDARRELAHMGLQTSGEKHPTGAARNGDDDLLWIAAVLLERGGIWSASHSIPRYTLTDYRLKYPRGLDGTRWRLSYPRAFSGLVARNAKANQIPEALQWAIMREESAFSPRIESFANAIGLTQMLVKTARRFSNGATVTREVLMDPVKNLEYGSRFLGFLWTRFAKAAPLAIASYNAGEGAVDRWLSERGRLAMDEFIETIPYDETRNYTKRVLASYFAYSWLYDARHPVPAVPLTARPK